MNILNTYFASRQKTNNLPYNFLQGRLLPWLGFGKNCLVITQISREAAQNNRLALHLDRPLRIHSTLHHSHLHT